jgi:hypothetical protein
MVRALEQRFKRFTLKHIPRSENVEADELAKAVANNLPMSEGTFYSLKVTSNRNKNEAIPNSLAY